MLTIKTTDELIALANNGVIKIEGDCEIKCNIQWRGVGEKITNLSVRGYLSGGGDLNVGGYLSVGGYLDVGGYLSVGGDLNVGGNLYWSHASMPTVGGTMSVNHILPPAWQRSHWAERLGVELVGCYGELITMLQPELPRLLAMDKWSKNRAVDSRITEGERRLRWNQKTA